MSRIGNKPVQIPAGVEVAVNGNNVVVKGPKGQLELDVYEKLAINIEDNVLTVSRPDDERETRARHGLTRALIHNMVVGVSEGFEKKLELAGVGYRVQQKGKNLEFSLGFSHPVIVEAPEGITFEVPDNTHVNVKGINKQQVGQIAAEIRGHRPPEPYKGKGLHKTSTPLGAGKINLFRSLRMNKHKAKLEGLKRRQRRVRGKISGTAERPRLRVTRTNANIYAQIIDDSKGSSLTLVSASTLEAEFKGTHTSNKEAAEKVGQLVGKRAIEAGITKVAFDRGGRIYHGRVKALADGARAAGLEF